MSVKNIKNRILEVASRVFVERGYSAVKVDDISSMIGISKKTIYNHFTSKRELYNQSLLNNMEGVLKEFEDIAEDKSLTFIEKLEKALQNAALSLTQLLSKMDTQSKNKSPMVHLEIKDQFNKRVTNVINKLAQEGIDEGVIEPHHSVKIIPYIYVNMIRGFMETDKIIDLPASPKDMLLASIDVIFKGILTKKGKDLYLNKNNSIIEEI